MNGVRFITFAAAFLLWCGTVQASEFVIISTTVSTLTAGQIIGAGEKIILPEKGRAVLIDESGRTVALKGPYAGIPGGGGGGGKSQLVAALSSLISTTEQDTRSVGAIRAAGIQTMRQALMINLSETGDYCLLKGHREEITRYEFEKGASITITAAKGGKTETLPWPKGSRQMAWPGALPLADGATYLVGQEGKDTRTMLVMHRLSGQFPTHAHLAISMAVQGCMEQARMVLALMRREAK